MNGFVCGNLGRDAELKDTGRGKVLEFNVAENTRRKVDGSYQDHTEWYRVSLWRGAESKAQWLKRGTYVTAWGEFEARPYIGKDGSAKAGMELRADGVKLGPKQDRAEPSEPAQHHDDFTPAPEGLGDDIPF